MELENDKLIVCRRHSFQVKAHYNEDIRNVMTLAGAGGPIGTNH